MRKAIKFIGFEPDSELADYALCVVKDLKMMSPSRSFVMLNLRMVSCGTYEGSVDIKSFQKHFFGSLSAGSPNEVLELLFNKLKKQIDEWKEIRFDSEEPPSVKELDSSLYGSNF